MTTFLTLIIWAVLDSYDEFFAFTVKLLTLKHLPL